MVIDLESLFDQLWPINRSLTGKGNRESLKILSQFIDLSISEVPSGETCFDWNVPAEWNIKEAWIKDSSGKKIVDFANNNLHILGYSTAINQKLSGKELKSNLYSLPNQPNLIPYLTSYYQKRWGFCITDMQLQQIDEAEAYHVFIDSELNEQGSMTVAEAFLQGDSEEEILISTYICHPSMASNELSGPLVTTYLYQLLKAQKNRRYSYRFLFHPETIGALYHLREYSEHWREKLVGGFVVNCIGDNGAFTYKQSRIENSIVDRATELILQQADVNFNIVPFFPRGSDERQYCSPGFNLPVGSLMRTMYGQYPEYHTSGDNKDYISFEAMVDSSKMYFDVLTVMEKNKKYLNLFPYGEPQLGKRGLYPTLSEKQKDNFVTAMMWLLNFSDGHHDLIDIAKKSGINVKDFYPVIEKLIAEGVIRDSSQ